MIPNLKPLIEPLTTRFPAAWAKAKAPHDDGEFNARVCAVLHYELGMLEVGRNGKRGNPATLSKDVINWKGEGPNPDPVTGGFGTIIDFIGGHESPAANIIQITPDPNGPGAWVQPLTLAQIDAGGGSSPTPQPTIPSYEALGGDAYWRDEIGKPLQSDMAAVGQALNDGSSVWFSRPIFRILAAYAKGQTPDRPAIIKSVRNEWRAIIGLPPVP